MRYQEVMVKSKATLFEPPSKKMSPIENVIKIHKEVFRMFPNKAERTFLYRVVPDGIIILSKVAPRDESGCWRIGTGSLLLSKLQRDQKYYFEILVNAAEYVNREQNPRDIVNIARYKLEQSGIPQNQWPSDHQIVQNAAQNWLAAHQRDWGLDFLKSEAHQLNKTSFIREKEGRKDKVPFELLKIKGAFKIKNAKKFRQTYIDGIGRQRGYGCGLFLLKNIS